MVFWGFGRVGVHVYYTSTTYYVYVRACLRKALPLRSLYFPHYYVVRGSVAPRGARVCLVQQDAHQDSTHGGWLGAPFGPCSGTSGGMVLVPCWCSTYFLLAYKV